MLRFKIAILNSTQKSVVSVYYNRAFENFCPGTAFKQKTILLFRNYPNARRMPETWPALRAAHAAPRGRAVHGEQGADLRGGQEGDPRTLTPFPVLRTRGCNDPHLAWLTSPGSAADDNRLLQNLPKEHNGLTPEKLMTRNENIFKNQTQYSHQVRA